MAERAKVFGTWEVIKPLGTGTYGKAFEIRNIDGEKGVYKVMRVPVEIKRNERGFPIKSPESCLRDVKNDILGSIKYIRMNDSGRYFTEYKDCTFTASRDYTTLTVAVRMEKLMSLSDIIDHTVLSEEEVIRLAVNVCRCLEKCREMEYVYCNLKPNNIFITERGCKLGDLGTFGVYEPNNMNVAMRKSQEFMAPEMIKFGEINATSDTYSLGLIMYYLLNTNRLPFIPSYIKAPGISDITAAIEKRCANYIFQDPDSGSAGIKAIIQKACSSSVGNRYEDPTEMKNELLSLLGETREENPFAAKANEKASTDGKNNSMENIKMYEYEDKKQKKGLDRKKKILLLAIAVVFAVLVGVVIFITVTAKNEDAQSAIIILNRIRDVLIYYE